MPAYCDVALPVPLDRTFTYAVNGTVPSVGARVLVPFSGQRLMGVVVRVHDDPPADEIEVKPVQQVLDDAPLLSDELMRLAAWIAQYYVAPLGEVLRSMMPLAAEVKRHFVYRIADAGRRVALRRRAEGFLPSLAAVARGPEPRVRRPQLPGRRQACQGLRAALGNPGAAKRCWTGW